MNILSLFDGMSCGQLALHEAGIEYNNYYASEIDKYTIAVTQHNFPNTIQLGDIKEWRSWNLTNVDMIIGGSPCQGFSNAGKHLNFDDSRSKLFFDFIDILNHYKPQYFLLENVRMKQEWKDIISDHIGVKPILINSALVSAQSRKRLYWTNIPNITQPEDKKLLLQNIIESGMVDRDKSYCIDANYDKGGSLKNYLEKKRKGLTTLQSERRLMVAENINQQPTISAMVDRDKSYCLKANYNPTLKSYLYKCMNQIVFNGFESPISRERIVKNAKCIDRQATALTKECANPTGAGQNILFYDNLTWRKLTPLECERLQTVPDNYNLVDHPVYHGKMMSNSQRYKMLGNGWTVAVIAHIFSFIKAINEKK